MERQSEKTEYVVTKRGKPVAKLTPIVENTVVFAPDKMRGTATIKGDIMAPIDVEDWGDDFN